MRNLGTRLLLPTWLLFAAALPAATLDVPSTGVRLELDAALLTKLPRTTVQAPATEHGPAARFEGVSLRVLLDEAKVPSGKAVRGEFVGWGVVVEASDGYRAVFALAEIDPSFTDHVVILADRREGKPLDEKEGPLRTIAADEKRPGRWVRNVTRLVVGPLAPATAPAK